MNLRVFYINFSKRVKLYIVTFCISLSIILMLTSDLSSVVHSQETSIFIMPVTAKDYFSRGNTKFNFSRDLKGAIEDYTQATRIDLAFAPAYYKRGSIHARWNDDKQKGIKDYTRAIQIIPTYAEAYYWRGFARSEIGDKQGAIEDFTQVISIDPNYAQAYYQRGLIYSSLDDKQKAITDYIQVIRLDPGGKAFRGDNEKALDVFPQLFQDNPELAHIYYRGLARFYARVNCCGDFELDNEAIADLTQSIQLKSDFTDAYYYRAMISFDLNQSGADPKVILDFNQSIKFKPDFAEAYYLRGLAKRTSDQENLENRRNNRAAIDDLTQAIKFNSNFGEAYYYRGIIRSQIGDEQGAIEDYIHALRVDPSTYIRSGEFAEKYIQSLQPRPKSSLDYHERGLTRAKLKDFIGAIKDFTHAIQLNPKLTDAYYRRGLALSVSNPRSFSYKLAIEDFTKVIQLNPEYTTAYFARGNLRNYIRSIQSEKQRVIQDFTSVIHLNSKSAEAYYYRGYLHNNGIKFSSVMLDNYAQAIRLNPEFSDAFNKVGYFADLDDSESAKEKMIDSKRKTKIEPKFSDFFGVYSVYEIAQFELKNIQSSIEMYSRTIQENPEDLNAYFSRGSAYLKTNDEYNAIQDFSRAIQLNSQDFESYYSRGIAKYKLKDYQGAIEDYTLSLQVDPDYVNSYSMRSLAYYDLGKKSEALKDANKAILKNDRDAVAYLVRTRILIDFGQWEKAVELQPYYSDQFVSLWPFLSYGGGGSSLQGNPATFYDRGRTLARLGDKKGAIENLFQAARLFQAWGNMKRYQETQNVIRQLKR